MQYLQVWNRGVSVTPDEEEAMFDDLAKHIVEKLRDEWDYYYIMGHWREPVEDV